MNDLLKPQQRALLEALKTLKSREESPNTHAVAQAMGIVSSRETLLRDELFNLVERGLVEHEYRGRIHQWSLSDLGQEKLANPGTYQLDQVEAPEGLVFFEASIRAGNRKAGAKSWGKVLKQVDLDKEGGYAFEGTWMPALRCDWRCGEREYQIALPAGQLVLLGGSGGSRQNSSVSALLLRVGRGEEGEKKIGYQDYSWSGAVLIASTEDACEIQEVIDRYPKLAPWVGSRWLPIVLAYLEVAMAEGVPGSHTESVAARPAPSGSG
ncbi:hypothetical protein [Tautonia marina]|uniref:hypothetical protein n=1 Tax=Tautonia marina TaxID=2653855 RepID=UPI001260C3E2|nr:hypothetical protein [Tautonia marina]